MDMRRSHNVDPHDLVMEFHTTYEAPIGTIPMWPTIDRLGLRMDLIEEELKELQDALRDEDFIETVDALGDMVYVIYGMAIEMGINLGPIMEEIHASNLSKLADDGTVIRRADGKVLKGPNFREPDLIKVIEVN